MEFPSIPTEAAWHLITRLGEAQILLPALAAVLAWFVWRLRSIDIAAVWLVCIGLAALLTTVTKVAFIGWGIGIPSFDFTGISGHAMFAASVLPVLGATAVSTAPPSWRPVGRAAAYAIAGLITLSRVVIHAHSSSEAVAGFALGCIASGIALHYADPPRSQASVKVLAAGLAAWLSLTMIGAPPSRSHDLVTALSLRLSGHSQPYTRSMQQRRYLGLPLAASTPRLP